VDALVATAETVLPRPGPLPAATAEEVECVLRWLEAPGTRLVRLEGTWASPAFGAGGQRAWLEAAQDARAAVRPFDDRRRLRPEARPARAARLGRPSRGVAIPTRG
jgi:DNA polymerase-3 subunit epsilon